MNSTNKAIFNAPMPPPQINLYTFPSECGDTVKGQPEQNGSERVRLMVRDKIYIERGTDGPAFRHGAHSRRVSFENEQAHGGTPSARAKSCQQKAESTGETAIAYRGRTALGESTNRTNLEVHLPASCRASVLCCGRDVAKPSYAPSSLLSRASRDRESSTSVSVQMQL